MIFYNILDHAGYFHIYKGLVCRDLQANGTVSWQEEYWVQVLGSFGLLQKFRLIHIANDLTLIGIVLADIG